jgi:transposase-like protein
MIRSVPSDINLDDYTPDVLYDVPDDDHVFTFHTCYRCDEEYLDVEGSYTSGTSTWCCKYCQRQDYYSNREARIEATKKWQEENKHEYRDYLDSWRKWNKDLIKSTNRLRNQRVKDSIPEVLKGCPIEKLRLQNIYKLCDLMSKVTGEPYHVDHMWPLSDGGPHWSGNLQVIPAKENLAKHAKVNEQVKQTIQEALSKVEKPCSPSSN